MATEQENPRTSTDTGSDRPPPIDSDKFATFFDKDYRLVREHEFRQAVFRDGIVSELRPAAWKFLFQFYPFDSTPRERHTRDKEKFMEYSLMRYRAHQVVEAAVNKQNVAAIPFDLKIDDAVSIRESPRKPAGSDVKCAWMAAADDDCVDVSIARFTTILSLSRINIDGAMLAGDAQLIDKDVPRTGFILEQGDEGSALRHRFAVALRNILVTFAAFNQTVSSGDAAAASRSSSASSAHSPKLNGLGYTQGMNELASVFLSVFDDESVAYWCFSNHMLLDSYSTSGLTLSTSRIDGLHALKTNVAHYFSDHGMTKKVVYLRYLLREVDAPLVAHLDNIGVTQLNFCHEWLLLSFKRCFATTAAFERCFEIMASRFLEVRTSVLKNVSVKDLYPFDLFVCLALIGQMRERFMSACACEMDSFEVFQTFNKSGWLASNLTETLANAERIFERFAEIKQNAALAEADIRPGPNDATMINKIRRLFY